MKTATKKISKATSEQKNAKKDAKKAQLAAITKKPKEAPIGLKSGMTTPVSEEVGIHYRASTLTAPTVGDMICVQVKHEGVIREIGMMVRHTRLLKSGLTLVMAFLVKNMGQKDHLVLRAHKGEDARVIWGE